MGMGMTSCAFKAASGNVVLRGKRGSPSAE